MELSLFYFAFILFILLSTVDPTEFDTTCPTSRHLLFFGGFNLPLGEKKPHRTPASPPKYARSSDSQGLTVYIQPQTSNELGHKIRSYTHLLKSKLYTKEEKLRLNQLKRLKLEKKKQLKKKNSTQHKPVIPTKTQELVAINDKELDRCRAILQIDSTTNNNNNKKTKKFNKNKPIKQSISSNIKNATTQTVKNIKKKATKTTLPTSKTNPNQNKPSENRPLTPPVTNIPTKTSSPPLQPSTNIKSKRNKPQTINVIQETIQPFDATEDEIDEKNNSVVDRAYHFVKNMFQLSENFVNVNPNQEDRIIDISNEQPHHHHSRKLLSLNEDDETNEHDLYLTNEPINDRSFHLATSVSKRRLLSFKTNKQSTGSKTADTKEKKTKSTRHSDPNKPKVGWAYRYRISRYFDAQKGKHGGNKNKATGGEKNKPSPSQSSLKQNQKKTSSSSCTKISKRKLLEYETDDDDDSNGEGNELSDEDIINSVSITKKFIPKRQLLVSKTKDKHEENNNNHADDLEKANTRRRIKSFDELTDPIAIIQSYDRGLYKPRVGWQFRYRVSRYIDSLRENIREDQERLKVGLQAIKRKTPQELSGRRKRVLDKPFASDSNKPKKQEETTVNPQADKPNVGWRYRYRVSKMNDAKKHGKYIDDEEEKRRARLDEKKKQSDSQVDNEPFDGENDLDPELRKINAEGRRVGWAYRYRIRCKLDHLKQQQAETGLSFDLATLTVKDGKKPVDSKIKSKDKKKKTEPIEQKSDDKTKSVGWKYRYRVSKMREAQKSKPPTSKKQVRKPTDEQLDPELSKLTPEEKTIGWKYRYRIQRKLDSNKNTTTHEIESGKRPKRKDKKKIIKKVEESIENILNIDDIDETPFMEYVRRTSSYIFSGLIPTAKKSLCLLPLSAQISFCHEDHIVPITKQTKRKTKKLKLKNEKRAKQFIRARPTKLGADDKKTERHVDEVMKNLYKKPLLPPPQNPPSSIHTEKISRKSRTYPSKRSKTNEHTKHFNKEERSIKKKIGVQSKKSQTKKQFQIIGQQVKVKQKSTPIPVVVILNTTPSTPVLRSLSEVIKQEANIILATKRKPSRTPEEINAETEEVNEITREHSTHKTTPSTLIDSTTSGEEDTEEENPINGINPEESVRNVADLEKK